MNNKFIVLAVLLIVFAGTGVMAQRSITLDELRNIKNETSPKPTPGPVSTETPAMPATKTTVIADGSVSKVQSPFVFVARDRQTFMALSSMIEGFKFDENIDFDKHAVVAAFSGPKNTGGYSVSIVMMDGKCEIEDVAPAHGAIVSEAVTHPFAVALVTVEEQAPLEVVTDDTWDGAMEFYDITSGGFEFSGGFIAMTKKFEVSGSVGILRNGKHISFFFNILEKAENSERRLFDVGSGVLDGKIPVIRRLEAGDLIDRPHSPLKVNARFEGNKVEMEFMPGERGYVINDGFEGSGKLTAVKRLVD